MRFFSRPKKVKKDDVDGVISNTCFIKNEVVFRCLDGDNFEQKRSFFGIFGDFCDWYLTLFDKNGLMGIKKKQI